MTFWLLPFIRADNNWFINCNYSLYSSLFDLIYLIPDTNSWFWKMQPLWDRERRRKICERGVLGNFYLAQPPSLPNDFRLIFIKQMVHTIAMPFYGTSKLVSKTSRDDAPCPPRGLFDAPSRSCWQLEPLKKNVRLVTPLQGYLRWVFGLIHEEMHVWCGLGMFGRSMAVSFVLSSIWERYDNMYLRCQKVSTLHEEYSKIYVIHIYTVFDEMYTCNKVYMNLIHLILTGDLWPPLTVDHSLNSLWYIL